MTISVSEVGPTMVAATPSKVTIGSSGKPCPPIVISPAPSSTVASKIASESSSSAKAGWAASAMDKMMAASPATAARNGLVIIAMSPMLLENSGTRSNCE